jgi:hypothetical protein
MKSLFAVLALASCTLGACAAPTHLDSPNGHPEVTISRTTPNNVRAAIVSKMIDKGFHVTEDAQLKLVFDRPLDNKLAEALLGSKVKGTPNGRITYSIAQVGDDVRVVADLAAITNPGSASERSTDMNDPDAVHDVQSLLDDLRIELFVPKHPSLR